MAFHPMCQTCVNKDMCFVLCGGYEVFKFIFIGLGGCESNLLYLSIIKGPSLNVFMKVLLCSGSLSYLPSFILSTKWDQEVLFPYWLSFPANVLDFRNNRKRHFTFGGE